MKSYTTKLILVFFSFASKRSLKKGKLCCYFIALVTLTFSLTPLSSLLAQQDPQYSKYMFDPILINPGFAGNKPVVSSTLTYKQQLQGIEGAPQTQSFTLHSPIQTKYIGLGLKAVNENLGVTNKLSATGIYAYQLGLGPGKLSIGIEGGIINYSVDWQKLIKTTVEDGAIPQVSSSTILPDFNAGLFFNTEYYYVGLSAYHLTEPAIDFGGKNKAIQAHMRRHFFGTAGGVIEVGKILKIVPSTLVKYVINTPLQLDANASLIINDLLLIGASYRMNDAIVGMVRVYVGSGLQIGYAYDYRNEGLSVVSNPSHEIMLNFNINLPEPAKKKTISPRFYF